MSSHNLRPLLWSCSEIQISVIRLHNSPTIRCLADSLAPDVEWDSKQHDRSGDRSHLTERNGIASLLDPRVCVERKEEAEAGYRIRQSLPNLYNARCRLTFECKLRHQYFSSDRSERVDSVNNGDVVGLNESKHAWDSTSAGQAWIPEDFKPYPCRAQASELSNANHSECSHRREPRRWAPAGSRK